MEDFATTMFFDEIFPTFNDWKEFSHQLAMIGDNPTSDIDNFDHYCYDLLYRQFAKQNIRYDRPELFLNALASVYEEKFRAFKRERDLLNKIYNITFDELEIINNTVSNIANNPNTKPDDPTKPLQYVSAQTFTRITDNKLRAYMQALNNLPMLNIERFIFGDRADPRNKYFIHFSDLFMQILPRNINLYEKGEN